MFDQWSVEAGLRKGEEPCEAERIYARYVKWCHKKGLTGCSIYHFIGHLRERDFRVDRNGAFWYVFLAEKFKKRGPRITKPKPRCPSCNKPL